MSKEQLGVKLGFIMRDVSNNAAHTRSTKQDERYYHGISKYDAAVLSSGLDFENKTVELDSTIEMNVADLAPLTHRDSRCDSAEGPKYSPVLSGAAESSQDLFAVASGVTAANSFDPPSDDEDRENDREGSDCKVNEASPRLSHSTTAPPLLQPWYCL